MSVYNIKNIYLNYFLNHSYWSKKLEENSFHFPHFSIHLVSSYIDEFIPPAGNIRKHVACFLPSAFKTMQLTSSSVLPTNEQLWSSWVCSWRVACIYAGMDNLGFSETPRPAVSSFHWTLPIKSLPSPTLSSLPHPCLSYMHTSNASAVSFVLYWAHFPGMQPDLGSIHLFIGHLQLPRIII